jgi:phage terminase large subunit
MIIGQRSNGKTYSVMKHIIENYLTKGERAAYIRRYEEDITPKNI